MSVTLDSQTAWVDDDGTYNNFCTTAAFSPGAGTLLLAFVHAYDKASPTISNSGTALTWSLVASDEVAGDYMYCYRAINASAQSNITVTWDDSGAAYNSAALKVLVFSGVDTSSPIGNYQASRSASSTTSVSAPTGTVTSASNSVMALCVTDRDNRSGALTSDLSNSSAAAFCVTGTKSYPTSGTSMSGSVTRASGAGSLGWQWVAVEIKPVGGTTHSASASLTATATLTAAATPTRVASAALSSTATLTAAATVNRAATASLSATATLTAAASVTAAASASLAATATLTAAATVTSSSEANAALSATATLAASALVSAAAAAALTATATLTAAATVTTPGASTPGRMVALDLAVPRMVASDTPPAATMRVALLSYDEATIVVTTDVPPSPTGAPLFIGPDDPVTLGLVADGVAHLWIEGTTLHPRAAS